VLGMGGGKGKVGRHQEVMKRNCRPDCQSAANVMPHRSKNSAASQACDHPGYRTAPALTSGIASPPHNRRQRLQGPR
jgi:hypothetical protein